MDPNANLREQRQLAAAITKIFNAADPDTGSFTEQQRDDLNSAGIRLAELVAALDQWISGGGFLPGSWARHQL